MNKSSILIIGKTPPPIGGVSVHIERLLYSLRQDDIPFESMSLSLSTLRKFIPAYLRCRIIHLNITSVYVRALLTLTSFILNKKHVNTYHGNLGSKKRIKNMFDKVSIYCSAYPVVLNDDSRDFAIRYNKRTIKISAFIPPASVEPLKDEIKREIGALRVNFKELYCTNAYGIMYDDNKHEIYGISELVRVFSSLSDRALILSDPAGSYKNYFEKNNITPGKNILIISEPHSFVEVLKLTDTYIRNTSTDGDSLSVKEALYLRKNVIATNCVQRPEGVILCEVNNSDDLIRKITEPALRPVSEYPVISGYPDLKRLYEALFNGKEVVFEKVQEGKA